VVINGPTRIGKGNKIFQFSSIGEDPQDLKYAGERSTLEIADNNVIREYVTMNRGTGGGGGTTRVGSNNLFMAYIHVAHAVTMQYWLAFVVYISFALLASMPLLD